MHALKSMLPHSFRIRARRRLTHQAGLPHYIILFSPLVFYASFSTKKYNIYLDKIIEDPGQLMAHPPYSMTWHVLVF
jgi:hypothetical protein